MVRIAVSLVVAFVATFVVTPWLWEHWGRSGLLWAGGALLAFGLVCILVANAFRRGAPSGEAD
jgi:hypothetical protein